MILKVNFSLISLKTNNQHEFTNSSGTTTSISFVKDVLFTYAYRNCAKYLENNYGDDETQAIISELVKQSEADGKKIQITDSKSSNIQLITDYVRELITKDVKVKPLKELQGKIWRQAYESSEIHGHVFDDVLKNFQKWTSMGIKIFIYSSGSVEAQKLLFSHSKDGDLTQYLSGYFDTSIGGKTEARSYTNILNVIDLKGENVLFLSDILGEVFAAKSAGIYCHVLMRPGNKPITNDEVNCFKMVNNFDEIQV